MNDDFSAVIPMTIYISLIVGVGLAGSRTTENKIRPKWENALQQLDYFHPLIEDYISNSSPSKDFMSWYLNESRPPAPSK